MDVPAKGQVGGIESDDTTRRRLASESRAWKCATCGKGNVEILAEQEKLAKEAEAEGNSKVDEKVPEELKLVYKDDLKGKAKAEAPSTASSPGPIMPAQGLPPTTIPTSSPIAVAPPGAPRLAPAQPVRPQQTAAQPPPARVEDIQLDAAIWVISGLLVILVARMLVKMAT